MYCKKCGKFIGTDADTCDECQQKESAQASNLHENVAFYQPPTISQDTSVIALGKSIAAMILSTIGFIFAYAGILVVWEETAAIVCFLLGLVPSILGLVFGIQAISNFKKTSYLRSGKRIPLLILGISSVAEVALSLFLSFCILIIVGSI